MRLPLLAVAALLLVPAGSSGASTETRPVSPEEKRQAIATLASTLRARYAVGEIAEAAAKSIEEKLANGEYDAFVEAQPFSDAVEADLRAVTHDKHLAFGVAAPPEPRGAAGAAGAAAPPPSAGARAAARAAQMRRGNYGLPRAEVLPGNVGYLEVRRFQPPEVAGDTIAAALAYLANVDAVIVDLRHCRGGSAHVMPIFAGYFLARPTSLYDMEFRGDDVTERFWTLAWLPGKRLAEVPMFILTSAYTFSGAEGLAYRFQVLKRATIVGETTGGGANAGGILDIAPFFQVWMPMGRPVDRDTQANWEGSGVVPDLRVSAREALAAAHSAALDLLEERAASEASEADRARFEFARELAHGRHHPPLLGREELQRFVGTYGSYRLWVEGDQLRMERATQELTLLVPLARNLFASETNDPVRVEFVGAAGTPPIEMRVSSGDGTVEVAPRRP